MIAFQDALRLIRSGECDVVLAGGSEAPLLPIAFAALGNMGALSKRNDDPTHASRPFDRDRDGFLFGEGAGGRRRRVGGSTRSHARRPPIQAEVIGASLTADAFHISAPEPTGRGATMAMERAMRDAGIGADRDRLHRGPRHVDAAQRRDRDAGDQGGVRRRRPTRSRSARPSRWSATCSAPRARSRALTAIGAIRDGIIPPTINLENPDLPECDLDYVPDVEAQGAGRHGDDQRLRVRRPERGRGLPPVRGVAAGAALSAGVSRAARHR